MVSLEAILARALGALASPEDVYPTLLYVVNALSPCGLCTDVLRAAGEPTAQWQSPSWRRTALAAVARLLSQHLIWSSPR